MDRPKSPTFVLQANINCCKACQKRLKKLPLKLNGVDSIEVDPEKRLVYVTGKIDPKELIKVIKSKMNKIATLVPDEKEAPKSNHHVENKNKNGNKRGQCGEEDGYCCFDNNNRSSCGGHKAEGYRGPWEYNRVDEEERCRDKFYPNHKIRNSTTMGDGPIFPQRGYYGMPPPRPPPLPHAFAGRMGMGMPMRPPPPPPPPFGYGYNYVDDDYFGDQEKARDDGCSIM